MYIYKGRPGRDAGRENYSAPSDRCLFRGELGSSVKRHASLLIIIHVCIYMCIYIYIHTHMCVYMCTHIYICMYIHIYMYIYVCV